MARPIDSTISTPAAPTERNPQASPSAIAVAVGLSKSYGTGGAGVTALDDVSVEIARGRLTAIMGPSGPVDIATALFGAVLGCLLGLGLGVARQRGPRSQGLDLLAIPWTTIAAVLVASIVVIIAPALPSARAIRLNILRAIATEA